MPPRFNAPAVGSSASVKRPRAARTSPGWHVFTALTLITVLIVLIMTDTARWTWYGPGVVLLVVAYVRVTTRRDPAQFERMAILVAVMVGFTLIAICTPFVMLLSLVLIAQFFWFLPPFAASVLTGAVGAISAWALFYHNVPNALTASLVLSIAALMGITVGIWLSQVFTLTAQQESVIEQLRESRAEVARQAALKGASEERNRVAQDIHDGLAQQISATLMLLRSAETQIGNGNSAKALERVTLARQHTEMSIAESRFLLGQSRLDSENSSVPEQICLLVELFEQTSGISAEFTAHGDWDNVPLPEAVTRALLRIASEALSNCLRHSQASLVSVELSRTAQSAALAVSDNGVGFDRDHSSVDHTSGWGLQGMPQRIESLDGTFELSSEPGHGTRVHVTLPIGEESNGS